MRTIRVLAILEAATITGPTKNLLEFARWARTENPAAVEVAIATFQRAGASDVFLRAARDMGIPVEPIPERGRYDRSVVARAMRIAEVRFQLE